MLATRGKRQEAKIPRNGVGVYNLPASSWNPAVTGTTIESSAANTTLSDLAAAMTQSISKDGQTPWTGQDNHANNKIINVQDGSAASDVMTYGQGAKLNASNTFTGGTQTFESTDAGASAGPNLVLYRNSASPAASDFLGAVVIQGKNADGAQITYASISPQILTTTSGAEWGRVIVYTVTSGSTNNEIAIGNGLTVGSTSALGVGTIAATGTIETIDTGSGGTSGPTFSTFRDSGSPAALDELGQINFDGRSDAAARRTYASIRGAIVDPVDPGIDGAIYFYTVVNGTVAFRGAIGHGIYLSNATGGDMGDGSLNAKKLYIEGVEVGTSQVTHYYGSYSTNADLSTVIPLDDTIPTNAEGTQIISVAVTTASATERVRLTLTGFGTTSGSNVGLIAALYRGTTCIHATDHNVFASPGPVSFVFEEVPGSAAAHTYTVRVGAGSGTARMNGTAAARLFGGVAATTLAIDVWEP